MKRVFSMLVAMLLLLTAGFPAIAEVKGNSSITIKNDTDATGIILENEKYFAYKIMNLDKGTSGTELRYTVDSRFVNFFTEKASLQGVVVDTEDKLNDFANKYFNDNKDNMQGVAKELKIYIDNNTITKDGENGPITTNGSIQTTEINNLDLGYYIIIDQGGGQVIAAAGMGNTNPNLEINLKASKPTVDKEIQNNDDNNWGVVGDNQIGDDVNYRLKATLPTNITGYTSYTYTLHDTLDKGLTFNDDVEVYVGDKDAPGSKKLEVNTDYTLVKDVGHTHREQPEGATLFDISVNVKEGFEQGRFNEGDTLYIYYSAKLNENAVVAGDSNDNNLYLEYSNNPYDETSKEEGPDKIVKDYTFKINGLKTNEAGNPLKGAEFNIIKDGNPVKFKVNTLEDGTNEYIVLTEGTGTETIVSGENGRFNIIGLDDNVEYTLTETKAPEGYNSIRDIKFIITASYDEQGNITSITTNTDSIQAVGGSFELGTTIVNKKATLLPETGGMGTALYSLVGGTLMVSALGVYISKRKKNI